MKRKFAVPRIAKQTLRGHRGAVNVVRFNQDGEYCLSGSSDRTVILWNPTKNNLIKQYSGVHNYDIADVAIVPDNSRFASVGGDKYVYMWDVKSGHIIRKLQGHGQRVNCCTFNSDQSVLATGSYDASVKLWDLKSFNNFPIDTLKNFKDSVSKIIIQDFEIIASSIDGTVKTFDVRMGELLSDSIGAPVHSIALANGAKTYLASGLDSQIRLVERGPGEVLQQFKGGHRATQFSIECRYTFDDALILTGSEDGCVYFYDLLTGEVLHKLKNHCRPVSSIDVCPNRANSSAFLSASYDNTITYWTPDANALDF